MLTCCCIPCSSGQSLSCAPIRPSPMNWPRLISRNRIGTPHTMTVIKYGIRKAPVGNKHASPSIYKSGRRLPSMVYISGRGRGVKPYNLCENNLMLLLQRSISKLRMMSTTYHRHSCSRGKETSRRCPGRRWSR